MSRRSWEFVFGVVAAVVAALTAVTVPPARLGPWSAGVLDPLVAIGAAVCVLSWPPQFDADPDPRRTPWRWVYLVPLVVVQVVAPRLMLDPPPGLSIGFVLALAVFVAYLALLLGVVVFLTIRLPIGQLLRSAGSVLRGRRMSGYGPGAAALALTVTLFPLAGAFALDGLPDDEFGLFYLMAEGAGVDMRASPWLRRAGCWWLGWPASRCSPVRSPAIWPVDG